LRGLSRAAASRRDRAFGQRRRPHRGAGRRELGMNESSVRGLRKPGPNDDAGGFSLSRDAFGRLVLRDADGAVHVGVVPVRAFPISAADEGISLLGTDGRERVWIDRLSSHAAATRSFLLDALAAREVVSA